MKIIQTCGGEEILLGRPARPISNNILDCIADIVGKENDILEAHMPQCFIVGLMERADQVLILVHGAASPIQDILARIEQQLGSVMPDGQSLLIWPMTEVDDLLETVRQTNCQLIKAKKRSKVVAHLKKLLN